MAKVHSEDHDIALRKEVERAAAELARASDELLEVAETLPFTARRLRPYIESLAFRLRNIADGLSQELRDGVDPESVRLYTKLARRAFVFGIAGISAVGLGVGQQVGSEIVSLVVERQEATEVRMSAVESALANAPESPNDLEPLDLPDDEASRSADAQSFSGREAAEIVGITYRQLDYWARTDLVRPSFTEEAGSPPRRRYSYTDLLELRVIKSLLDAGIRLESVRAAFDRVRPRLGRDLTSIRLVVRDGSAVLVDGDEELVQLLSRGEAVVNEILPLDGVQAAIDRAIGEMRQSRSDDL